MAYYNNRNYRGNRTSTYQRRGRTAAPYQGRSRHESQPPRRRRNRRRTRNRIIIVATGLVILALIIALISSVFSCICSSGKGGNTIPTATKSTEVEQTSASKTKVKKTDVNDPKIYIEPEIKDDKKSKGELSGGLYIWNKKAFELFYGSDERAKEYAKMVNSAKKSLGKDVNVYSMIVPNHTEMGLPSRLKNTEDGASTLSQAGFMKTAYAAMSKDVKPVNIYNYLSKHCNEYVYFDSDHHWTGLGAYYAYKGFAKQNGLKVPDLSKWDENIIEGFTGTFVKMTELSLNTDAVHYWTLPYEVSNDITDDSGNTDTYDSVYYEYAEAGTLTYGVFLRGDNPLEVITSESKQAEDRKIAVVHESYGNAIVPFFTYNYSTVYSIDFRSWSGNLKKFCAENEIDDVIFVNGVMSAATAIQVDAMNALI